MSNDLQKLVIAAGNRPFLEDEREAQRRSFAYGNTHIENELITRQMINKQAEVLEKETANCDVVEHEA